MKFSARVFAAATFPLAYLRRRAVNVASALHGWTVDRRREVRIRDLRLRMQVSFDARDYVSVQHLGRRLFAECNARSAAQCRRMERRLFASLDPHAQAVFERSKRP